MDLALRPARPSDVAEIMRLERAGFAEAIRETEATFAERLAAAPEGCWVLDAGGGRLSGYLCAEFWPLAERIDPHRFARDHAAGGAHTLSGEEIYVSSMVVDPATRGTGWGRRLFRDALAAMAARHPQLQSVILIVHPHWHAARRIYSAEGFVETGEVPAYFDGGECTGRLAAIVMRRPRA